MAVTGIDGASDLTSAFTNASSAGGALDKDAFLQLLITQLRFQDPLSPMQNEQFVAQLAQFSSLEQMESLNSKFDDLSLLTQSLNNSSAAGLIGRQVRASGESVRLGAAESVEVGYFLPSEATEVTMTIYDGQGRAVRTLHPSEGAAGAHRLTWDGRDDAGVRLPAGDYKLQVEAKAAGGEAVSALSVITGPVEGVTFKNGSALLIVNGVELPLSSVLEVFQ